MTLNEMIFKRKSCRSFTNIPVDSATIETIRAFPMRVEMVDGSRSGCG